MKWFLLSVGIWSDGSYIFQPLKSFDSKAECLEQAGKFSEYADTVSQKIKYETTMCIPEDALTGFFMKWKR